MAGRADGLNDIFEHDVIIRGLTYGKTITPVGEADLVNKKYVDDELADLTTTYLDDHPHQDVQTTASPSFVGATFTDDVLISGDISATNLNVDHIGEKTVDHDVVFDNDVNLGTGVLKFGNDILFGGLFGIFAAVGTPSSTYRFSDTTLDCVQSRDLGSSGFEWKDLYLSGKVDLGTNTITDGSMTGNWNFGAGTLTTTGTAALGATTISTTTEPALRINNTGASNNSVEWVQLYNKDSAKMVEIGSNVAGNPEIRFGDAENTRVGFPDTDPTYFAFINDETEIWLGNAADPQIYMNYYVGSGINIGRAANPQNFLLWGTAKLGDGGTTNYTEFSATGDQVFIGSAGLPFGSFYGNEFNQSQAMTTNTEYQVAHASIATGQSNNITTDGNGKFTITKAGKYHVVWHITASHSAVGKHVLWGIALDQLLQVDGQHHRETIAADKEYNIGGDGIIDVAVGEDIEIGFKSADGTPGTALISHMSLSVLQVGG